jgi:hypothetical protein
MRRLTFATLLLPLAAVLAGALAVPVAAVVDAADYVIWRGVDSGIRDMGVITNGSPPVLRAEYIGLAPNETYRLVVSSARCHTSSNSANRLISHTFDSDLHGARFLRLELEDVLISSIKSVRLFHGPNQLDCGRADGYSHTAAGNDSVADGFAVFNSSVVHGEARVHINLGSGDDELSFVGHGFMPSENYRIVASKVACPNVATPNSYVLKDVMVSSVRGTASLNDTKADASAGNVRSIQLFHGTDRIACSRSITVDPININPN